MSDIVLRGASITLMFWGVDLSTDLCTVPCRILAFRKRTLEMAGDEPDGELGRFVAARECGGCGVYGR